MWKYIKLYKSFLRANVMKTLAYRGNFWLSFFLTAVESIMVFFGLAILFLHIDNIAGWSYSDMLVLIGVFTLTHALAWMLFKGGVGDLDKVINKGDLDWYLIKPIDTQFIVTFQRIDIVDSGRSLVGIALIAYGLKDASLFGTLINLPLFIVTIFLGQIILYSITLAVKTVSFKSIQGWATSAISWRFHDIARYPTTIYQGMLRFIYTFIFPLLFIATVPAQALMGNLELHLLFGAFVAAAMSLCIVRIIWNKALSTYSSASS